MHHEHIDDAIDAAAGLGRKVLVLTENLRKAQAFARCFEGAAPQGSVSAVSRVAGRASLDFHGGGRIIFLSLRQSARGLSVDRVLVPSDTPPEILANIVPATAASEDGQITGY